MSIKLFGLPFSPYVRKAMIYLEERDLGHQLVPTPPHDKNPEFIAASPLGKIPALQDGDFSMADSSIIISYLEKKYPDGALLPADAAATARSLWAEEYVDSKLVGEIAGHLYVERILAKPLFNRDPIQADIDQALNDEVPAAFAYLESLLTDDYIAGPTFTVGDCAVTSILIAYHQAGETIAGTYPALQAYWQRVTARPAVQKMIAIEGVMMKQILKADSPLG